MRVNLYLQKIFKKARPGSTVILLKAQNLNSEKV